MKPEEILYPQSRFEVLRTLHKSSEAVSLREISYRSQVVLNNVQRAVEFLLSKKFISKKKVDQRIFYQITNEEVSSFLDSLLKVLEPFEIQSRSHALNERALELLDTMEERSSMITHAKRKSGR
jgi:predicted transcriptional regulator